jgi:hypothetical protein
VTCGLNKSHRWLDVSHRGLAGVRYWLDESRGQLEESNCGPDGSRWHYGSRQLNGGYWLNGSLWLTVRSWLDGSS